MLMVSVLNLWNFVIFSSILILIFWLYRNPNCGKPIKFLSLKATLQSAKTVITFSEEASSFSSELTSYPKNSTLLKKLAWKSCLSVSRLLSQLGLSSTTYIFQTTQLTQQTSFNTSLIKPGPSSLILGDFNGHPQMRDSSQPQNQRGDAILDWIIDNDLHILNDGSATRTSRITGNAAPLTSPFVGATGQWKHLGD